MCICALFVCVGEGHNKPAGNVLIILIDDRNYLLFMLIFLPFCIFCSYSAQFLAFAEAIARRCSVKKMFSKLRKFTGKHLCWGLFFNNVIGQNTCVVLWWLLHLVILLIHSLSRLIY